MSRRAVSVTLDEANLTWLRGRARIVAKGNLSETLDRLIADARTGGREKAVRSVVGTVTLPADDPDLRKAKETIRALFAESLSRPLVVREPSPRYGTPGTTRKATKRARRG